mmetsp:Transcript_40735/g.113129  ORF Transcript_40735/g.113129 Transcript_40735/m.113129 type:complete len:303 (+) Transcript_40735:387-1295(+)
MEGEMSRRLPTEAGKAELESSVDVAGSGGGARLPIDDSAPARVTAATRSDSERDRAACIAARSMLRCRDSTSPSTLLAPWLDSSSGVMPPAGMEAMADTSGTMVRPPSVPLRPRLPKLAPAPAPAPPPPAPARVAGAPGGTAPPASPSSSSRARLAGFCGSTAKELKVKPPAEEAPVLLPLPGAGSAAASSIAMPMSPAEAVRSRFSAPPWATTATEAMLRGTAPTRASAATAASTASDAGSALLGAPPANAGIPASGAPDARACIGLKKAAPAAPARLPLSVLPRRVWLLCPCRSSRWRCS